MISIQRPGLEHASGIAAIGRRAFAQAFGHLFPDEALRSYLGRTYDLRKIEASLSKADNRYLLGIDGERVVGFIKAKINSSHPDLDVEACQLQKLYVLPEGQSGGVGTVLLQALLGEMPESAWWLQVYSGNERARRFYARHGFWLLCNEVIPVEGVRIEFCVMVRQPHNGA